MRTCGKFAISERSYTTHHTSPHAFGNSNGILTLIGSPRRVVGVHNNYYHTRYHDPTPSLPYLAKAEDVKRTIFISAIITVILTTSACVAGKGTILESDSLLHLEGTISFANTVSPRIGAIVSAAIEYGLYGTDNLVVNMSWASMEHVDKDETLCIHAVSHSNITYQSCELLLVDNPVFIQRFSHLLKEWHWTTLLAFTSNCAFQDIMPKHTSFLRQLKSKQNPVGSKARCKEAWRGDFHIGLLLSKDEESAVESVIQAYSSGFLQTGNVLIWLPDLVYSDVDRVSQQLANLGYHDIKRALDDCVLVMTQHMGSWNAANRRNTFEMLATKSSTYFDLKSHFESNIFDSVAAFIRDAVSYILQKDNVLSKPLPALPLLGKEDTRAVRRCHNIHVLRTGTYIMQERSLRVSIVSGALNGSTELRYFDFRMDDTKTPLLLLYGTKQPLFPHMKSPIESKIVLAYERSFMNFDRNVPMADAITLGAIEFFSKEFPAISMQPQYVDTAQVGCTSGIYTLDDPPDLVVGSALTDCTLQMGLKTSQDNVPQLAPGAVADAISDKTLYPSLFRLGTPSWQDGQFSARMIRAVDLTCVTVVYDPINRANYEVYESFKETALSLGLEIRASIRLFNLSSLEAVVDNVFTARSPNVYFATYTAIAQAVIRAIYDRSSPDSPWIWILSHLAAGTSFFPDDLSALMSGRMLTVSRRNAIYANRLSEDFLSFESSVQHAAFRVESMRNPITVMFADAVHLLYRALDQSQYIFGFDFDHQLRQNAILEEFRKVTVHSPISGFFDPRIAFDFRQDFVQVHRPSLYLNKTLLILGSVTADREIILDENLLSLLPTPGDCDGLFMILNLEEAKKKSSLSSFSIVIIIVVLMSACFLLASIVVLRYRYRNLHRHLAHDFREELEDMRLFKHGKRPIEIKRSKVKLIRQLGEGFFAHVWEGDYYSNKQDWWIEGKQTKLACDSQVETNHGKIKATKDDTNKSGDHPHFHLAINDNGYGSASKICSEAFEVANSENGAYPGDQSHENIICNNHSFSEAFTLTKTSSSRNDQSTSRYFGLFRKRYFTNRVAVKMVPPASNGMRDERELRYEAVSLAQFSHCKNIVQLIGVVTAGTPMLLVMELCENGSLDTFLQHWATHDRNFSWRTKLNMALDIASGMKAISQAGGLHMDLAARNVLVAADLTCKVSDFGLFRDRQYYAMHTAKIIPVRWTAPEALNLENYSSASDVWSFGIVLFEIATNALSKPYSSMSNKAVVEAVANGYRLPQPPLCPNEVYALMRACWMDADSRPSFAELVTSINALLTSFENISQMVAMAPSTESTTNVLTSNTKSAYRQRLVQSAVPKIEDSINSGESTISDNIKDTGVHFSKLDQNKGYFSLGSVLTDSEQSSLCRDATCRLVMGDCAKSRQHFNLQANDHSQQGQRLDGASQTWRSTTLANDRPASNGYTHLLNVISQQPYHDNTKIDSAARLKFIQKDGYHTNLLSTLPPETNISFDTSINSTNVRTPQLSPVAQVLDFNPNIEHTTQQPMKKADSPSEGTSYTTTSSVV